MLINKLLAKLNKLREHVKSYCSETGIIKCLILDDEVKRDEALKIYKNNIKLFILKIEHMRRRFK